MGKIKTIIPIIGAIDTRIAKFPPKTVDPFYATPEYRDWRERVILRAGGRCEAAGCGRHGVRLFADHIVELQDSGAPLDAKNGQALCGKHHSEKTARVRAVRAQAGPGEGSQIDWLAKAGLANK